MVEVGEAAPDFTLPGVCDGERRDYTLSEFRGRKVVLAFYPGRQHARVHPADVLVPRRLLQVRRERRGAARISPQDVDSHEKWAEKRGFHFPLLADTEKQVIELYGVKGGKLIAVKRSVFVVGPDGKVRVRRPQGRGRDLRVGRQARPRAREAVAAVSVDTAEALEFIRSNHHGVMATRRADGLPAMSPIACDVDADGKVVVSTRETAMKVKHLAAIRTSRSACSTTASSASGYRSRARPRSCTCPRRWTASSSTTGSVSGEHPDWDDYRAAMERDRRVLLRITVTRSGPNQSG